MRMNPVEGGDNMTFRNTNEMMDMMHMFRMCMISHAEKALFTDFNRI